MIGFLLYHLISRVGVRIFAELIVTNQTWRFSFMKLTSTIATIGECEMFVIRQCLNQLLPELHKRLSLHLRHPWMNICLFYNSILSFKWDNCQLFLDPHSTIYLWDSASLYLSRMSNQRLCFINLPSTVTTFGKSM